MKAQRRYRLEALAVGLVVYACVMWATLPVSKHDLYNYRLLGAIDDNDPEAAKEAIASGADVNALAVPEYYPCRLLEARHREDRFPIIGDWLWIRYFQRDDDRVKARLLEVLLSNGAKIECRDIQGRTPLEIATYWRYNYALPILLAHGARVDARDLMGRTALDIACTSGFPEIVTTLISAGADINVQDPTGTTPIAAAIYENRTDCVRTLISAHANIHMKDKNGRTPFELAMKSADPALIKLFVDDEKKGRQGAASGSK